MSVNRLISWPPDGEHYCMLNFLTRVYVAFSLVSVGGGLAMVWADGDHLLQSDDPYLVGFFLGLPAAALAAIYLGLKRQPSPPASRWPPEIIYFGGLLFWAMMWLAIDHNAVEGKGLGMLIAFASTVAGIATWFLCQFQLPAIANRAIGLSGAIFVGGYIYVATLGMR